MNDTPLLAIHPSRQFNSHIDTMRIHRLHMQQHQANLFITHFPGPSDNQPHAYRGPKSQLESI